MRVADRPTPEGLEPRPWGHPVLLIARTAGGWRLSGELRTSLILVVPGFPTDYIPAAPLSLNMSQLFMGLRSPKSGIPGHA